MFDKKRSWLGGKSLWDVLQAVGVPISIALGVAMFGLIQARFAEDREDERQSAAISAEATREAVNLGIQLDRSREDALQRYIDSLTALILDQGLSVAASGAPVREVARAKTLTVLKQLDGVRKGTVLQFLQEARLIGNYTERDAITRGVNYNLFSTSIPTTAVPGIIDLTGADLSGAQLEDLELNGVYFGSVNLHGANLHGTKLNYANFCNRLEPGNCSDFTDADMRGIQYFRTSFLASNFTNANLEGAFGTCTYFNDQVECGGDFTGATFINTNLLKVVTFKAERATWQNTICYDGTNSDDFDGDGRTCLGNQPKIPPPPSSQEP